MKNVKDAQESVKKESSQAELTHDQIVFSPRTDIYETPEAVIVLAEMPGIEQKNISVTLEEDLLTITGTVSVQEPKGLELLRRGYHTGGYRREFRVLVDVDHGKISAKTANGVLRIVLPKSERVKPKKINIEVA